MKRVGIILLLTPALLEIISSNQFTIMISGLPYSLGKFSFILIGLAGLKEVRVNALGQVGKSFVLIYAGMLSSSLLNGNVTEDISRSLGIIFLFLAALGWSRLFLKKTYLYWLDILMISLYIYWMFYTLDTSFSGVSLVSYSKAYLDDKAINHHIPGLSISTATFYLLLRFFSGENRIKPLGFVLLGISISTMLVLESRSNFLVCIIMTFLSFNWIKKGKTLNIFRWAPLLLLGYFIIALMIDRVDFIGERFALNSNYQENTNKGRIEVYALFPYEFAQNPFGRGPNDIKLDIGRVTMNAHNQYLTQIISGGVLALFGVLGFFVKQIRMGIKGKWFRNVMYQNFPKQIYAGYIASLVFFITLFTIEQGSILMFICLSILLYAEHIFDSFVRFKLILE